jgi:glycosyltransferase involved in cell wall biosynthesis
MKVLMLSKACIVGAYQRKLEEIAALGVELTVVVPPYWKDATGILRLEKQFLNGYRLLVAPMRFNGHFHLHYYPSLASFLHSVCPDIVHIDEEPWDYVTYSAVRSALAIGARPLFFSWQNLLRHYPPPFSWFERYVFQRCRFAIAGNTDAQAVLRAKGYDGSMSVIPQFGVDPNLFHSPGAGQAARAAFTIAYAGRLIAVKGIDTLLRAVVGLAGDWHIRLAGSGPQIGHLRRLASRLGIAERVTFDMSYPSSRMPDFFREVDVLVLPSLRAHNWVEQFGRVLVEAMACGVPVIGADTGEIPNTIGDAGLTFPAGDVPALRAHLECLMRDAALRRQLSERGRARVLAHFTQANIARRTVDVYRQMLSLDSPLAAEGRPEFRG